MSQILGKLPRLLAVTASALVSAHFLGGCGGEQGGVPSGVAGALTNAQLRISSFGISTTGNALAGIDPKVLEKIAGDDPAPGRDAMGLKGVLFPSLNAHSFRLIVKGAGVDKEDVIEVFPVIRTQADVQTYNTGTQNWGVQGTLTPTDSVHPIVDNYVAGLTDRPIVVAGAEGDHPVYVPVSKEETKAVQYNYLDTKHSTGNDPVYRFPRSLSNPGAMPVVFTSQQKRALRLGHRAILVEFYTDDFTTLLGKRDQPSEQLQEHLTNVYAFDADITEGGGVIDLSGGFQGNVGDNGYVDSNSYRVSATNVPPTWGSVVFEAYEQKSQFVSVPLVFKRVINKGALDSDTSVKAATDGTVSVESSILIANRQRKLRVYATCYSESDGQGIRLGQIVEDGHYRQSSEQTTDDTHPVQFIPAANAAISADEREWLLKLKLKPALSALTLNGEYSSSFPQVTGALVKKTAPLLLSLRATETRYARYEPDGAVPASLATTQSVQVPNSLLNFARTTNTKIPESGIYESIKTSWLPYVLSAGGTPVDEKYFAKVSADGSVSWNDSDFSFSQNEYVHARDQVATYKGVVTLIDVSFKAAETTEDKNGSLPIAVRVAPNDGSVGGGVIK